MPHLWLTDRPGIRSAAPTSTPTAKNPKRGRPWKSVHCLRNAADTITVAAVRGLTDWSKQDFARLALLVALLEGGRS